MKLILITLSLCLWVIIPCRAQHQITAAEYFFDSDPGVSLATSIIITTPDDSLMLTQTLNVPSGLTPGIHFVYLRTYADSAGYKGRWSIVGRKEVIVMPEITAAEYFIDLDPGVGQGVPLAITPGDTVLENLNITIPTSLVSGQHYLYVRTKSSSGIWGLLQRQSFFVSKSIVAAEYFIDTDPGLGQGISLSITPGDTVLESLNITIPSSIASGQHYLYVRTKSSTGIWSLVQRQSIFVSQTLVAAEYFIDTDPGVGQGIALSIATSDSVLENLNITLPSTITSGLHHIYTRTKSIDGIWGLTQRVPVYVKNKLLAAEYFFDTDPGLGNGFPWLGSISGSDSINSIADIKLPCLTAGMHFIYVRSQDALGVWGLTAMDTFYVNSPTLTLTSEWPGPGPYGTPVRLHAIGGEGPYLFNMDGGAYLADSLFLAENGTAISFNVTDTCGYSGSVVVNTPAAPTSIATTNTSSISLLFDGWRYWVYLLDGNGDIVAAVKDNGQNLGLVTAGHLINSGTVRQFPPLWDAKYYLDRNWVVNAQFPPLDSVALRLYALNTEYNALAAVDPIISNYSDLRIIKYDGPNEDLSFANNNASLGAAVITPDSLAPFTGGQAAGYWLDFRLNSFSEFYQSSVSVFPLYIQKLDVRAIPLNGKVQIIWDALVERDLSHYTIQRSTDGIQWKSIGNVNALNKEKAHYSFDDEQPEIAWNFYRLMLTDKQNKTSYSIVVRVHFTDNRSIALYPNPARDEINIQGTKPADRISMHDAIGREVWSGEAINAQTKVSVNGFTSGVYLLRIVGIDGSVWSQKLEIVKD